MNHHKTCFSIIVPTFREAKNIPALVSRVAEINFGRSFEMILVDDNSQDGIVEVVEHLQSFYPWLKLIVRKEKKSLSASAVVGFQEAQYPVIILMDADLSHPPEKIPEMVTYLSNGNADFVVGSRYIKGGSADEIWPLSRKLTSRFSALLARLLISSNVKDPLSGFFALKKETLLLGDNLRPIGWKIGLEIMLKCHCKKIKEVPIHFSERLYGKSKLNLKVAVYYLLHINRLMFYKMRKYVSS